MVSFNISKHQKIALIPPGFYDRPFLPPAVDLKNKSSILFCIAILNEPKHLQVTQRTPNISKHSKTINQRQGPIFQKSTFLSLVLVVFHEKNGVEASGCQKESSPNLWPNRSSRFRIRPDIGANVWNEDGWQGVDQILRHPSEEIYPPGD